MDNNEVMVTLKRIAELVDALPHEPWTYRHHIRLPIDDAMADAIAALPGAKIRKIPHITKTCQPTCILVSEYAIGRCVFSAQSNPRPVEAKRVAS